MSRRIHAALAAAGLAVVPAVTAQAQGNGPPEPRLEGRAVLPVDTYAPGPPSGAFYTGPPNGITFPTPSQPVLGFSGVVEGRRPGEWLAMPDNGFGSKANSPDFLLRAYYLTPDFKTAKGGTGSIDVGDYLEFTDPDHLIGFPIVREGIDRRLTGSDVDPESIQRGRNGDLWVGDEFGPWLLHFDAHGRLLDPPFALPDGLVSPNNPHLAAPGANTVGNSRGIEGMAMTPDGKSLIVILEGATLLDAQTDTRTRRVYQFDLRTEHFTRLADYRTEVGGHLVADVQAADMHRLLVIERDGGLGLNALFRRVYEIDMRRVGPDGTYVKTEVVDLAAIPDPDLVSLPPIHTGDVGLGDPFRVTCESVEVLRVISRERILVGCDNNFPNTGRNPGLADDSEFIVVRL